MIQYRIRGRESRRPYPQRKQCARDARKQAPIHMHYFPLQAKQADKTAERGVLRRSFGNDRPKMAPVRFRKYIVVVNRREERTDRPLRLACSISKNCKFFWVA